MTASRFLLRAAAVSATMAGLGYLVGYAAGLSGFRQLGNDQQAWAVFALGLIAAIVLLFRASRIPPPVGTRRPPQPAEPTQAICARRAVLCTATTISPTTESWIARQTNVCAARVWTEGCESA